MNAARFLLSLSVSFVSVTIGCSSDVKLQLDSCTTDSGSFDVGDQFPDEDGCNTCVCEEGGEVVCTDLACAPCADAEPLDCDAPLDCFYEANVCVDGVPHCGELICDGLVECPAPEPDCPQPADPGCYSEPYCDVDTGTFSCVTYCDGD